MRTLQKHFMSQLLRSTHNSTRWWTSAWNPKMSMLMTMPVPGLVNLAKLQPIGRHITLLCTAQFGSWVVGWLVGNPIPRYFYPHPKWRSRWIRQTAPTHSISGVQLAGYIFFYNCKVRVQMQNKMLGSDQRNQLHCAQIFTTKFLFSCCLIKKKKKKVETNLAK